MRIENKMRIKHIDFSERYLNEIVALAEARLGEMYTTVDRLKAFIQDENNACKLVVTSEGEELLGFLLSHSSDIPSLASEMKLTSAEIEKVVGANDKIYVVKTLVLQKKAEKHGLATELTRQGLLTAKRLGFCSAWSALWVRKDGFIPAKHIMERLDFTHYKTVHLRMYNQLDFKCLDCGGRCTCDSAIYYKIL